MEARWGGREWQQGGQAEMILELGACSHKPNNLFCIENVPKSISGRFTFEIFRDLGALGACFLLKKSLRLS